MVQAVARWAALGGGILAATLLPACANLAPDILAGAARSAVVAQPAESVGEGASEAGQRPEPVTSLVGSEADTGERWLRGTFRTPDFGLVSNDSAGLSDMGAGIFLSDVGGGMFYRTLATLARGTQEVTESVRGGAEVQLETPDAQVLAQSVWTDEQGRFAIRLPSSASGSLVVRIYVALGGVSYAFGTLVTASPAGGTTADVDLASSLVANTVVRAPDRANLIRQLRLERLGELLGLLRGRLRADLVPYMASGSADVPALFGQFVEEDPDIRAVARGINPRLGDREDALKVETVFTTGDLVRLGLYDDVLSWSHAGPFAVDASGDFYLPRYVSEASEAIEIVRISPEGATASFAFLPPGYANPVLQAFGPDGGYWAAALHEGSREVHVFKQGPSDLVREEGVLVTFPTGASRGLGGRLAVDARGNVVCTLPQASVVLYKARGEQGRILAGSPGKSGFADGRGEQALFLNPSGAVFGLDAAIYVTDEGNRAIRRVSRTGIVTTVAGAPDGDLYRNGRGQVARFGSPQSLVILGRSVIVADVLAHRIRRISAAGMVFTVAGSDREGMEDGPASSASLSAPKALRLDVSGNLYFLDRAYDESTGQFRQMIRKISRL
ncbi:MAG: hypothetical protein VKO21_01670 [Candidatus Sericytochromatia bacterium]|nr:hypothetical protein [Candidatus Sericytochromatia bacterium]